MKMNRGERLGLVGVLVGVPVCLAMQAWAAALVVICAGLTVCWLAATYALAQAKYEHALRIVEDQGPDQQI